MSQNDRILFELLVFFFLILLFVPSVAATEGRMYRYDAGHTGDYSLTAGNNSGSNVSLLWSVSFKNRGITTGGSTSPVAAGGVIYVNDNIDGYLLALNATTGSEEWNASFGDATSSPAFLNGIVYAGSWGGTVFALNASNGKTVWTNKIPYPIQTAPVIKDDAVYFTSDNWTGYYPNAAILYNMDETVYAFNATTGAQIWSTAIGGTSYSSPAVSDDILVMITNNENDLYALNKDSGMRIWNTTIGGSFSIVPPSPAINDGMVFVGTDKEYAFNLTNGISVWNVTIGGISSDPAIAEGTIYFCSNQLTALNESTGALLWNAPMTGTEGYDSVIVANNVVYLCDYQRVMAYDAKTGSELWSWDFPGGGNMNKLALAVIENGVLYEERSTNSEFNPGGTPPRYDTSMEALKLNSNAPLPMTQRTSPVSSPYTMVSTSASTATPVSTAKVTPLLLQMTIAGIGAVFVIFIRAKKSE